MNILELRNITHLYRGKKILDVPSLFIEKGHIYSLVGPNGSGKTTLLSIMSLILPPTSGKIYFQNRLITGDSKAIHSLRRSLTMVLQNPYLFNMSVAKNIAYGLSTRGIPRKGRESGVKRGLELVGLPGFEKRRARELSGGELQLIALARAFVLNPDILFLDEPTANVDLEHAHQFEDIVLRINREQGTTIIMTTHNLSQAYRMTERVFSLFRGNLVTSTMHNLFSGKMRNTDDGSCFEARKISLWVSPDNCCDSTHATIDPEDIIISQQPFASSARNRFEGIITQICDQGKKIFLEVQSQELFKVLITEQSFRELSLNIGSRVYLTFKASSVHLL